MDGNEILQARTGSATRSFESVLCLEISQYTFAEAGASACTAISLAALSKVLCELKFGNLDNISCGLTDVIFESINCLTACTENPSNHLSVDELTSVLPHHIRNVSELPLQGFLSNRHSHFRDAFAEARRRAVSPHSNIGIIITKPPETVCVILPPISVPVSVSAANVVGSELSSSTSTGKYYLFDPHARPQLGLDGAYLVSTDFEVDILQRLDDLFPPLPADDDDFSQGEGGGGGGGGGFYTRGYADSSGPTNYGAMMYNMFECWVFQVNE